MNKLLISIVIAAFVTTACKKDDNNAVSYPFTMVRYTEFKNMEFSVGGTDKPTTGLKPETFFQKEELSTNVTYFNFLSDDSIMLGYISPQEDYSLNVPYMFKGDSLIIESDLLEERMYLGQGEKTNLKKECGAYMFYGYWIKDGKKVDNNQDEVVDSHDKFRLGGLCNKFLTKQDVLDKVGYNASMLEATDTILIYNYTLHFVRDKNADRVYTTADN